MKRKILLSDTDARAAICKALGIKKAALSLALSFSRNSPVAVKAREMALDHGGILMEEKKTIRKVRVLNTKGETIKQYINE